jgi:hypothetical protein
VVERDLAKVDVAGSTPVSRSRYLISPALAGLFVPHRLMSLWTFRASTANLFLRGAVPKW